MKTIVVTGGTGLVGMALQSIQATFKQDFHFVFLNSKMCNLLNYNETFSIFNELKADYIIHLAACVGGLFKNMQQRVKMIEENLIINTNVLKCAYLTGTRNMVACLSTCIFPDGLTNLNETMINDGPPHYSNEGYAYSKRILEMHCKCYNEEYNTNFICIIPTNIYGPCDNFNLEDSHVIPGLIHRCFLAQKENIPFVVKGTGKPLRQFIYSIDLAKIIMEILLKYRSKESLIISPKNEYTIQTLAELINDQFGTVLTFDSSYPDGQYSKTADNSKLMEFLPNFEFTDLHSGVSQTIEWFKQKYPKIRK